MEKEIEELKKQNQILKSKLHVTTITLETVLVFIVPDNCRKIVEETLK